ncbi:roadblock/LC7 domain-containing protein [Streptomyces coffeae]|uniref:Roadblock/LC7 domain-containing protein n=1 Tax=Streptomyces coffeae TaxID=621382 RepID=A0ABS1NQZ9_9ACTN|nr:roadblock/LC7 domain-containing protein [Streptomyces coffeae]MBL1102531.1 roadblock/LC7 domain-containing protein [Streptomyces coffeae]
MSTHPTPDTHSPLDLLLTGLVEQVANVRHAVVVSEDGLVVSKSTSIERSDAERLAATASGLMSLGRGVCADFAGGAVIQSLIEMRHGFLVLTSAGVGAYLAVLCTATADVGVVAFEMNMLVKRIGEHLGAPPRNPESPHNPSGGA